MTLETKLGTQQDIKYSLVSQVDEVHLITPMQGIRFSWHQRPTLKNTSSLLQLFFLTTLEAGTMN